MVMRSITGHARPGRREEERLRSRSQPSSDEASPPTALRETQRTLQARKGSPGLRQRKRLQMQSFLTEVLEHAFAGMCSRRTTAADAEPSASSLQIEKSRRPDSNRGPLHYE